MLASVSSKGRCELGDRCAVTGAEDFEDGPLSVRHGVASCRTVPLTAAAPAATTARTLETFT